VLSASEVTFGYRRRTGERFFIRDLSLTIPAGSLTGLLGPNGSGKTTLLKLLSGVLTPDSGAVTLWGRPLADMPQRQIARRIATVPQETHPAFDYTCLEMVLMGRHPHLGAFEFEGPKDFAIVQDAMRATGTSHLADRNYMTLSGGEKQRVIIASALAQEPEVLLLDEPISGVDAPTQETILAILSGLAAQGKTLLITTHDLRCNMQYFDALLALNRRVIALGPVEQVLTPEVLTRTYGAQMVLANGTSVALT
jgi:iron complex transport system ATP-binding protein